MNLTSKLNSGLSCPVTKVGAQAKLLSCPFPSSVGLSVCSMTVAEMCVALKGMVTIEH